MKKFAEGVKYAVIISVPILFLIYMTAKGINKMKADVRAANAQERIAAAAERVATATEAEVVSRCGR